MKSAQFEEWMLSVVNSVKVSNQGAVYFFLNVLYHSALETTGARSPLNIFSGDRIYPLGPQIMYPYK